MTEQLSSEAIKVELKLEQPMVTAVEFVLVIYQVFSVVQEVIVEAIIGQPKALILFEQLQVPEPQSFEV